MKPVIGALRLGSHIIAILFKDLINVDSRDYKSNECIKNITALKPYWCKKGLL